MQVRKIGQQTQRLKVNNANSHMTESKCPLADDKDGGMLVKKDAVPVKLINKCPALSANSSVIPIVSTMQSIPQFMRLYSLNT